MDIKDKSTLFIAPRGPEIPRWSGSFFYRKAYAIDCSKSKSSQWRDEI